VSQQPCRALHRPPPTTSNNLPSVIPYSWSVSAVRGFRSVGMQQAGHAGVGQLCEHHCSVHFMNLTGGKENQVATTYIISTSGNRAFNAQQPLSVGPHVRARMKYRRARVPPAATNHMRAFCIIHRSRRGRRGCEAVLTQRVASAASNETGPARCRVCGFCMPALFRWCSDGLQVFNRWGCAAPYLPPERPPQAPRLSPEPHGCGTQVISFPNQKIQLQEYTQ
jgi:hypothetical protein